MLGWWACRRKAGKSKPKQFENPIFSSNEQKGRAGLGPLVPDDKSVANFAKALTTKDEKCR